jgi:two-component system NtrC family response regulator
MTDTLLIVDDDPRIRESLSEALLNEGWQVHLAESGEQALAVLSDADPSVVLSDIRMPGMSGLDLLSLLRERAPEVEVVLMTAYEDLPTVAEAMRNGAADFLVKPLHLRQLRRVLQRVQEDREARTRARATPEVAPAQEREGGVKLVGRDPRMIEIYKAVGRVAGTRTNVVIRGESGTGKELIAQGIHDASPWKGEPFVAVNCTALPATLLESELFGHMKGSFTGATSDRKGRFALAGRGTIFLDEIGDTPLDFQAKLLRVLQEHEYYPVGAERPARTEARVVAATHRNLEVLVESGEFREDLYYRLRVVEIRAPPLRERMEDLPELAEHLLGKMVSATGGRRKVLTSDSLRTLMMHDWPGNVRELENCLTRAAVLSEGDVIRPDHLDLTPSEEEEEEVIGTLDSAEKSHVARALETTGGNKLQAAEMLGVSRPRLDRLVEKHGLTELVNRLRNRRRAGEEP